MDINKSLDNFLRKVLWLWLPFYGLFELIRAMGERGQKK